MESGCVINKCSGIDRLVGYLQTTLNDIAELIDVNAPLLRQVRSNNGLLPYDGITGCVRYRDHGGIADLLDLLLGLVLVLSLLGCLIGFLATINIGE